MNYFTLPGSRKPIQLKAVDIKLVRDWVPASKRRRMDLSSAWARIKRHYCGAIVNRGVCPGDCHLCRSNIESIFDMTEEVRDPLAIIVIRSKTISARFIEERIAARKVAPLLPSLESDDPFYIPPTAPENPFMEIQYAGPAKIR